MDFSISQDHQMLADSLRRYFSDKYPIELRNKAGYSAPFHSPEVWTDLAELGVIGAFIDEDHGGFGGTAQDIAVVFEEVGRALCCEPLLGALMGARLLALSGQDQAAENVVAGTARAAVAIFEPGVVCNLGAISAEARQLGGEWRLFGHKNAIYGGPGADLVLIAAHASGKIGLFLAQSPDMQPAPMIDGGGIGDLVMDGLPAVCICEDASAMIEETLDLARIALCAEANGAMDRLIAMTTDYLKQRQQFGRPLATFQALQHRLVDMVMELEQSKSITIRAVASFGSDDQARHVAMAKNLIGRAGTKISEEAIQLHGGIGMTWEYAGSHYAKRLVMIDHQLGDRHDHAGRLSAMS